MRRVLPSRVAIREFSTGFSKGLKSMTNRIYRADPAIATAQTSLADAVTAGQDVVANC